MSWTRRTYHKLHLRKQGNKWCELSSKRCPAIAVINIPLLHLSICFSLSLARRPSNTITLTICARWIYANMLVRLSLLFLCTTAHILTSVARMYPTTPVPPPVPPVSVDGSEASQAAPSWGGEPTSGDWLRSKYSSGNTPTSAHILHTHAHTLTRKLLPPSNRETVGSQRKQKVERETNATLLNGSFWG